jgi:FixJ family two-component response regulator
MNAPGPTVFVIDDDPSVREALDSLLHSVGLNVRVFSTAQDFLQAKPSDGVGCLVLDVRMPGLSGTELQKELARTSPGLPIVFITAHGDIQMAVSAMQAGAVGFLTKPFRDQELLDAVQNAIARGRSRFSHQALVTDIRDHYQTLTAREREVMHLVASGKLNKQVAAALGVSEVTVKVHRAQVMRKMNARSLADLVRMVDQIETSAAAR